MVGKLFAVLVMAGSVAHADAPRVLRGGAPAPGNTMGKRPAPAVREDTQAVTAGGAESDAAHIARVDREIQALLKVTGSEPSNTPRLTPDRRPAPGNTMGKSAGDSGEDDVVVAVVAPVEHLDANAAARVRMRNNLGIVLDAAGLDPAAVWRVMPIKRPDPRTLAQVKADARVKMRGNLTMVFEAFGLDAAAQPRQMPTKRPACGNVASRAPRPVDCTVKP